MRRKSGLFFVILAIAGLLAGIVIAIFAPPIGWTLFAAFGILFMAVSLWHKRKPQT